jgi:hypothetical protein
MSGSACAGGYQRLEFNRRAFAMPSSGLRELERLHRRGWRIHCFR